MSAAEHRVAADTLRGAGRYAARLRDELRIMKRKTLAFASGG